MPEQESRFEQFEHRAAKNESGKMVIRGTAAMYDKLTPIGWYLERIRPGFFDTAKTDRCSCLKNHDFSLILGRTQNGTLKLTPTPQGLDYEAVLPDTTQARDTYAEIEGGYITQSSFSFTVRKQTWEEVDRESLSGIVPDDVLNRVSFGGKVEIRNLEECAELFDVSPVTIPAYNETNVEVAKRSYEEWRATHPKKKEQETNTEINTNTETDAYTYRLRLAQARTIKINTTL